jgi:SAM-dependent methyltransferase
MPTAGWWEALWPDPVAVPVKVGIKPDMDVIDLCAGDGWFMLQIAKLAPRVIAIDIDPALLEAARHRLGESGVENCDFVVGNAYDIRRLALAGRFRVSGKRFGVPDRSWLARSGETPLSPQNASRSSIGVHCRARKQPCWANRAAPERSCECRPIKRSGL